MASALPRRTVDVVIAARNAQATIGRAVVSALAQAEAARVVVVDDASGDDTSGAALRADDGSGRLVLIRQQVNTGPAASRNRALAACDSEWITMLDSDDYLLAGRLTALLAHAGAVDLVADDLLAADEGSDAAPRPMLHPPITGVRDVDFRTFVVANITHRATGRRDLGFIKPLIRRGFIDRHAIRYREVMRLGEDYELYARCLLHGARLRVVPAAGYVYTIRPESLSGQHGAADLRSLRDADLVLASLPNAGRAERRLLARHFRSVDCRLQWRLLIDAVKQRRAGAALATFGRSPAVTGFLVDQLGRELIRRAIRLTTQR